MAETATVQKAFVGLNFNDIAASEAVFPNLTRSLKTIPSKVNSNYVEIFYLESRVYGCFDGLARP